MVKLLTATPAGRMAPLWLESKNAYESVVSCLDVQGTVAILGMTVTASTVAAFPVGTEMSLTVSDGRVGGAAYGVSVPLTGSNCRCDVPNYPLAGGDILMTEGPDVPPAQYSDGTDNDADGLTDYPADPGCQSAQDTTEAPNPLIRRRSTRRPSRTAKRADT